MDPTTTSRLPEGTVTILFTDVVGSTALAASVGDRPARERLRAREDVARDALARHRGREIKATGDGVMAAFTSARRAVDCAIEIQRTCERLNLARPDDVVHLRIGLHSGEVLSERGDLFGSTVNAAARIQAEAGAGTVLVSEAVRMLLGAGSDYRLDDRGEFALRGFDTPWRLFEVGWRGRPGTLPGTTRTPLVGRDEERAALARSLRDAAAGHGVLALLGGEPGVGKSRLAAEVMADARAGGFLALAGQCYEMEGTPPYNPFVEILEAAARILDADALASVLGHDAPHAAKLVPRLRRIFPEMPAAAEQHAALERRLLLDAIRDILERLAAHQPLLLLFEDLHWADSVTLVLFQHVIRRVQEQPILLLVTYRDTEFFPERPLTPAFPELLRQPRVEDLRLKRLTRDAVAGILRAYGGRDAPPRFVDLVLSETEGNPFFVEQVLKHLTEADRLFDADGNWRTDVTVHEDEVPHGVRHVIGRRLERVSPDCRRTLTRAAVYGRAFSFELLRELVEAEEDTLLDAMDEAEAAQLIAPGDVGGESRLVFAHELIRQTLLGELSLPRRQRLHRRAADAIEAEASPDPDPQAAAIAHHLVQAGPAADAARTVRYLTIAGDQARAAAAFEDAYRLFDAALALVAQDSKEHAELLYRRGVAACSLGQWDRAEPDWRLALDAAEHTGAPALAGRIALDFSHQLGFARRPVESAEVARRGLALLEDQTSGVRARLLAFETLAATDLDTRDFDAACRDLDRAEAIAETAGDRGALGSVLAWRAHLFWRHMMMAPCADEYARTLAVLEGDQSYTLADARAWRLLALVALGRFHDADAEADGLLDASERAGHFGALFATRRALAYMDRARTGNLERWSEFAAADLALLESLGSAWTANSHAAIALGHFWAGRWDEAMPHAHQAKSLAFDDSWAGFDAAPLLLLLAYRGEHDAARDLLEKQRRHLPLAGRPSRSGGWELLPAAVEALAVLGDREAAAALWPVAQEAADRGERIHYGVASLPATTAGIAAACAARWEEAEANFEAALRQADDLPNRIDQPESRRWFARMLFERAAPGDREHARALLDEAVALYNEIDMPRHRELALRSVRTADA